ncbi:MAG TPA: HAD family hydrolase [Acidimicrobiales bacterium]|nr:HAD family hydrolase [Acidimicrobiales bacterium]
MAIEAVIFDWGGTLSIWAEVDIQDMWRLAGRHLSPEHEEELVASLVEVEARSWDRTHTDMRSTRLSELLDEASRKLGVDVAGVVLEEAAAHHLDSWTPHIRHRPEAAHVLSELRSSGIKLGLLSNTHWPRGFHEHFLERDGLAGMLDARLYTSEMEFIKPHPAAFRAALASLGGPDPTSVAFVGDRLYDDVFGARSAGMRTVWIRNDFCPPFDVEPDAVIDSLSELPAIIGAWRTSPAPAR